MTRLGMYGAELGHPLDSGVPSATFQGTVVTSPVRSGNYAFSLSTTKGSANYCQVAIPGVIGVTYFIRMWIRFPAPPASLLRFAELNSIGGALQYWSLRTDGAVQRNLGGGTIVPSPIIVPDTWTCFEVAILVDGSDRRVRAKLNGVQFEDITFSGGGGAGLLLTNMRLGITGSLPTGAFTVYVDDVAWNDDAGSVHNSWPGTAGKIGMLPPVADASVPVDWKLGAGGAWTNAWDSVNNFPPLGNVTADNTKQIRNAIAASNEDVDFRLQPYSTIEANLTDVVTAIMPYAEFNRASAGTGVEGSVGLVGKPVGPMVQTNAVGTGLSTWPGNWGHVRTGVIEYPSVVSADQPILRIGKRATGTSTLNVCLASLLVEYEPASRNQRFIAVA